MANYFMPESTRKAMDQAKEETRRGGNRLCKYWKVCGTSENCYRCTAYEIKTI